MTSVPNTHLRRGLAKVAAVAAAVSLAAIGAPASASATGPGGPAVPVLNWSPCHDGFQCATARVPLDYRKPEGRQISLAVIRRPATDPAHRIGSLFVNGGGPSAQVDGLVAQYAAVPAAWRARFDLITFDPRGFGSSTPVRCFPDTASEDAFLSGVPDPFPVGAEEIASWKDAWTRFAAKCARQDDGLLEHDSSANVARDMDPLRQAVGDPVLNYVGLSYGTGLGAIYANLFPGRVGRMVLDGNLDPVAWTRGDLPMFLRQGSDKAAAATMNAFLDLCGQASKAACAFSAGTPAATRAKYSTLLERVRRHPATIDIGGQQLTCGYACALSIPPVGQVSRWQDGAGLLQQLWTASAKKMARDTGTPATALAAGPATGPEEPPVYMGREQTLAVFCSDGPNPRDPDAYEAGARLAHARSGPIGLTWAWALPCVGWPQGRDGYRGPWNTPTANPILVVGNTGDPATPYRSSVAMARALADARLLTVDGYGHTAFSNPSACASDYETGYLLTGVLPPAGTVCGHDVEPFPAPSAG